MRATNFYTFEHQLRIRASDAFNAWHMFLGTAAILVARRYGWASGDEALGVLSFMRCKFCAYKRRRMFVDILKHALVYVLQRGLLANNL